MSRRKQANPAKLGDAETNAENIAEEPKEIAKVVLKNGVAIRKKRAREDEIDEELEEGDDDEVANLDDEDSDVAESDLNARHAKVLSEMIMHFKGNSSRLELLIGKIQSIKENTDANEAISGSLGTEHGSWGTNTPEQASPAPSSCPTPSSTPSDTNEGEASFTFGTTENTPYPCRFCNKAFARSSLLSKHEQTHADQLQYDCSYCPRLFKHKRSRDRHIKLHTGDRKYKCEHCDAAFSRSDHLKIHSKTHDNRKPYQCLVCNRGYNTAAALTSHQQSHIRQGGRSGSRAASHASAASTPSPGNFRCLQCSETFTRTELLQAHMSSTHRNPSTSAPQVTRPIFENAYRNRIVLPKLACMYCAKDFLSMELMQQHVNSAHGAILNGEILLSNNISEEPQIFTCDQCTMQCQSLQLLREHMNSIHWKPIIPLKPSPWLIKDCYCSPTSQNLGYDLTLVNAPLQSKPTDLSRKRRGNDNDEQSDNKKLKTEETAIPIQTSSSTSSPYNFERVDALFICPMCHAELSQFQTFLIHMEGHVPRQDNSTKASLSYCPICGEASRNPVDFNNHIFSHAVSNLLGRCCHACKKFFDRLEELQKHLMDMHAQPVYRCTICSEIFDTSSAIQLHFNNKHNNECKYFRCNLCPDQTFQDRLTAEIHASMQHSVHLLSVSHTNSGHEALVNHYGPGYSNSEVEARTQFFQCPFCQKSFKTEQLQYFHMMKEHREMENSRVSENYFVDLSTISQRHIPSNSPNVMFGKNHSPSENVGKIDLKTVDVPNCDVCNRTDFVSETELLAHKKLHHIKSKSASVSLQCAYCNEHCKSRSDLENHMKTHQVSCSKGKHKCNICDEIFTSALTLADHKLSHCKIVAGNSCTQCKTVLANEQSFYAHQLQHSPTGSKTGSQVPLPANCIICCQTLQTDVEIRLHANFHLRHLMQNEFLCGVCHKIFENKSGMMVKGAEKSNDHLPISICKDCSTSTNGRQNVESEVVEQNNIQHYSCIKCPQTFETEEEVQKHVANHVLTEGTNHDCHLCNSIFPSPLKLQIHVVEHSFFGIGQFRCYMCSAMFTSANGLLNHMLEHGLNSRPYECTQCHMKFFFRTELDNHNFDHLVPMINYANGQSNDCGKKKTKKYKICKYCSCTFASSLYYDEHVNRCAFKTNYAKKNDKSPEINDNNQSTADTNQCKVGAAENVTNETKTEQC